MSLHDILFGLYCDLKMNIWRCMPVILAFERPQQDHSKRPLWVAQQVHDPHELISKAVSYNQKVTKGY